MISLDVFNGVCEHVHQVCCFDLVLQYPRQSGVLVKQTTLDVDSWISKTLPLVLQDKHNKYQCLCDYGVKIIEVLYASMK